MNNITQTTSAHKQKNRPIFAEKKMIFSKLGICLVLVGMAAISSNESHANEFNYNELEMSISPDSIGGADPTVSFSGSYEFVDQYSVIGNYSRTTLAEARGIEVDFVNTQIGVAYNQALLNNTDFVASLSYVRTEIVISDDTRSASLGDGSGYKLGAAARHQLTNQIQLQSSISYLSVESATDTAISVGGYYFLTENISAGVAYTTGEFDGFAGSLRMNF